MKRSSVITGSVLLGICAALTLARAAPPPAAGGCAQLASWAGRAGAGTGVKFVDLVVGKWQEVWTHPMVHVACTGGPRDDGSYRLEGIIEPPSGDRQDAIRGVWTLDADGAIHEELLRYDGDSARWEVFYSGTSRRSTPRLRASATS